MTTSERNDPVVAGFERRLAVVESLIPPVPAWTTLDDLAGRRLRVVAGSAIRDRPAMPRARDRRWSAGWFAGAAVLTVAVAGVALMLAPPPSGPGQPFASPTASPSASVDPSQPPATVPPSLRGDTLLVQDTVDGNTDLYLMPLDGTSRLRLTTDLAPDRDGDWTPDGSEIVFANGGDGSSRLYLMGGDGTASRRLGDDRSDIATFDAYSPAVSPDGQSIAFIRSIESERGELWVVGKDGSGARRLIGPDHPFIADPAWAADGLSIYLMVDDSTGRQIEINRVDVATGELTRLDTCAGDDSGFALSPDGTQIVYESDCGGGLWIANSDFTDARRWYGLMDKGYPVDWSPDGRWVAYAPPGQLQLLDTTVTDPTAVLLEPAERPRWRPRPVP